MLGLHGLYTVQYFILVRPVSRKKNDEKTGIVHVRYISSLK